VIIGPEAVLVTVGTEPVGCCAITLSANEAASEKVAKVIKTTNKTEVFNK